MRRERKREINRSTKRREEIEREERKRKGKMDNRKEN